MSLQQIGLDAVLNTGAFEKGLSTYLSGLGKAEGKTNIVASTLGTIGKVAGGLAVAGIGAAAAAFGVALKSGTDMNTMLEKSTLQFTTLMGSSEKATQHVKDLFAFAAKTPFETEPILQASKNLLTFGGAALDTNDNLKLVGDAAAAVNMPIEEVSFWVGRAYSMIQAGKPFGEAAMRLQEMGILTADARSQLEEMQKAGKAGPEVWGTFQKSISKFSGAMELQANTWEGLTSTISDNLKMAAATALKPFFDLAKQGLSWLATFVQSEQFTTWAKNVASWLGTNLPIAINFLVSAWQGVLWPALQAVGNWMVTVLFPTLAVVYNWLSVNLPPAIAFLAAVWQTILLPALLAVGNWIGTVLIPILITIYNWLAVNLPPVIQALSVIWSTVLLPAIMAVASWISGTLIPILMMIFNWLSVNLPIAINILVGFWNGVLWPALQAVWSWITTYLVPLFQAVGDLLSVILVLAIQALVTAWNTLFLPAIQAIWGFINEKLVPIFKLLWSWLEEKLRPVFEWVNKFIFEKLINTLGTLNQFIQDVTESVKRLVAILKKLVIPSGFRGNSPSPFEISLTGIDAAMNEVTKALVPLQLNLSRAGSAVPATTSAATGTAFTPAANVQNISNVFNLGGQTVNNGMDTVTLRNFILATVREAL